MILIISSNSDQSTSNVIEWLINKNAKFIRINEDTQTQISALNLGEEPNFQLHINNQPFNLDLINSVWHRRSDFKLQLLHLTNKKFKYIESFHKHFNIENAKVIQYIHFVLSQKKSLGHRKRAEVNKLIVLESAKRLNLLIPETLITGCKEKLTKFRTKHTSLITKSISETFRITLNNVGVITNYTNELTDDVFKSLSVKFPLTLFQKNIKKKYELRIFFLEDELYCMAIFSQRNPETIVDFRRTNETSPNRTVPFTLPESVKLKIIELCKILQLNTGSIDMAVDENDDYIFFEVNPIGQYGMTSYPCNYQLDEKIADYLINT